MHRFTINLGLLVALLAFVPPAGATYQTVVIEKPFHAHKLAGVVRDPSGAPIEGVIVEDYDSAFGRVLASTITDSNGRFSFPNAKSGTTHFLSLKARGFNPLRITVSLSRFPRRDLTIALPIGG